MNCFNIATLDGSPKQVRIKLGSPHSDRGNWLKLRMYGPSQPYINWISFWYQPSSYVKACYGKTSGEISKAFLYHLIYFTVSFYEATGEKFLSGLSTQKSCASSQQLAYPELLDPVNLRTVFLSLPGQLWNLEPHLQPPGQATDSHSI